jgi:asparagine synthase (glutamine-hydrolysing)
VSVARHWQPPTFEQPSGIGFDAAACTLRGLLEDAVAERLQTGGTTAVFMSGGWDSPPVFAASQSALARARAPAGRVVPVSMSYPVGDPGREDEAIAQIAARWHARPHWCHVDDVPLFDRPAARAAARDEPLAHVYEMWNRSLLQGARDIGAHVALDGIGGDALFQISPVYLADLLAGGRWPTLLREWRGGAPSAGGARAFWQWAVRPAIPPALLPLATRLRGGRPFADYLRRSPPAWLRADFVAEHGLADRGAVPLGRRPGESRSALESRWHFTAGWAPSLLGALADVALDYEVELRSPLYDRRVIAFAATRPRAERRGAGETKLLVRAAMRGLLPDDVLAARPARTGTTSGYFARAVRAELPAILARDLRTVALADLGVVDAAALRRAAADVVRRPAGPGAVPLWFTLQTEWWVRARLAGADAGAPVRPRDRGLDEA